MRVLHLYSGNLFGGIETLLLTMARHQRAYAGLDHAFGLSFRGRLSQELHALSAPVHELGEVRISRPATVLRARRRLRGLLERERFDVAICHAPWSQAVFGPVVIRAKVPEVFWAHDAVTGTHWLQRWARFTVPDLVVSNSRFTAGSLSRLYGRARVEVVYAPVAPGQPITEAERGALRAELATPDDAIVIVQASRMERWKGHSPHLEALAQLGDEPSWVCWLVGGAQKPEERSYLAELRRRAEELGIADRVRFVGQRADVGRLLQAADVHCQPNTGPEPFGVAFVEALYAGLPVVTSDFGGAREIVDESCGFRVPPGDVGALSTVLGRLIRDAALRSRLGGAAPVRARTLSDPVAQARRLHQLLAASFSTGGIEG